jgi:hypothetical protein
MTELESAGGGFQEFYGLAARLEASYRTTWEARSQRLLQTSCEEADLSREAFAQRLEKGARRRDILMSALDRASRVDGWEPGCWRPSDVETTAADASFSAKLQRLGSAVGISSGQPE